MLSEPRSTGVNCIAPRINPNYIYKLKKPQKLKFLLSVTNELSGF